MMFYYPNGDVFSDGKDFVSFYSQCYYLKNSIIIENAIDALLYRNEPLLKREDVVHILAWKMDGLNKKACSISDPFVFKEYKEKGKEWSKAEGKEKAVSFGNQVGGETEKTIAPLVDRVVEITSQISDGIFDWEQILNDLKEVKERYNIKYISSVYLVTLLFFITRREYPIYDIQAMKAITAIMDEGKILGSEISVPASLPDIGTPEFAEIYEHYIKMLETFSEMVFGDQNRYKTDRNIDRALWTYGHFFTVEQNKKRNQSV